jgi:hypothetical protein
MSARRFALSPPEVAEAGGAAGEAKSERPKSISVDIFVDMEEAGHYDLSPVPTLPQKLFWKRRGPSETVLQPQPRLRRRSHPSGPRLNVLSFIRF